MNLSKRFGKVVRRLRLRRRLSQEELAFRADISVVYLSGIERGLKNPTLSVIVELARALQSKPSLLVKPLD